MKGKHLLHVVPSNEMTSLTPVQTIPGSSGIGTQFCYVEPGMVPAGQISH